MVSSPPLLGLWHLVGCWLYLIILILFSSCFFLFLLILLMLVNVLMILLMLRVSSVSCLLIIPAAQTKSWTGLRLEVCLDLFTSLAGGTFGARELQLCKTRQVTWLATCKFSHYGPTLWASLVQERRSAATAVHVSSHKALTQLLILHYLLILHDFIDGVCITLFVRLSIVIFIPLYLFYCTMYFFCCF